MPTNGFCCHDHSPVRLIDFSVVGVRLKD